MGSHLATPDPGDFEGIVSLGADELASYPESEAAAVKTLIVTGEMTVDDFLILGKFRQVERLFLDDFTGTIPAHFMNPEEKGVSLPNLRFLSAAKVTGIGEKAFLKNATLRAVSCQALTTLGGRAFAYISALKEAVFPNATHLGSGTFSSASALKKSRFSESHRSTRIAFLLLQDA